MIIEDDVRSIMNRLLKEELLGESEWSLLYEGIVVSAQRADHPAFLRIHNKYPEHLTPASLAGETLVPRTVVSYGVYFTEIHRDARSTHSPIRWVEAKYHFRELSDRINDAFAREFPSNRFLVPYRHHKYQVTRKDTYYIPTWSERHVAYACGLGTFGLHQSVITDAGCNLRLSSFITDLPVETSQESLKELYENCLFYFDGSCGTCSERCPVDALHATPKNIDRCREKATVECHEYNRDIYGIDEPSCGLCMIDLPCSRVNPVSVNR